MDIQRRLLLRVFDCEERAAPGLKWTIDKFLIRLMIVASAEAAAAVLVVVGERLSCQIGRERADLLMDC